MLFDRIFLNQMLGILASGFYIILAAQALPDTVNSRDSDKGNLPPLTRAIGASTIQRVLPTEENLDYVFAKQSGITASQIEIDQRKSLLSKLSKNWSLPTDSSIEQTIVSEKFFKSSALVKPTNAELRVAFDSLQLYVLSGVSVTFKEARPLLEMQVMLSKSENCAAVREKIQTMLQEAQNNALHQDKYKDPPSDQIMRNPDGSETRIPALWPVAKIQLDCFDNTCLVYNKSDGRCVLSCDDFNRQALTMQLPVTVSLDEVRSTVLDKSLNTVYYVQKAQEMGLSDDPELQKMISVRLRGVSGVSSEKKSIGEDQLRKLYEKLYDLQFAERKEASIDIVGSSDSLLVDSLYRVLLKSDSNAKSKKGRNPRQAGFTRIPWSHVKGEELPADLACFIDTLPAGAIIKPIKAPYGFFVMHVSGVKVHEEIPFEKAREQLILMLQNSNARTGIPASDKEAEAYFEKHKMQFISPDTFDLKVWLRPISPTDTTSVQKRKYGAELVIDTNRIKPLFCKSVSLPVLVRLALQQEIDSTKNTQVIGPVMSPLGEWIIKISSKRKGGHKLAYKDVAERIKTEIGASPQSIIDVPLTQRQEMFRDDLLATAAWRNIMESVPHPSDEEVTEAIRNGVFDLNALGPTGDSTMVRQFVSSKIREKVWRGAQDRWKAGLQINRFLMH